MRPLQGLALHARPLPSQIVYGANFVYFVQAFMKERGTMNLGTRRSSSRLGALCRTCPFLLPSSLPQVLPVLRAKKTGVRLSLARADDGFRHGKMFSAEKFPQLASSRT